MAIFVCVDYIVIFVWEKMYGNFCMVIFCVRVLHNIFCMGKMYGNFVWEKC